MTSFTQTFGGSAISPAQPSYQNPTLTANTQFYWPIFSAGNTNIIARFMNVVASQPNLNMIMPDATLASVGADTVVYNSGAQAVNVVSYSGTAIATVQPGTAWYVELIDNSSQGGTWLVLQFGAGSSSTQASSLAGLGLAAMAGVLNLNLSTTTVTTNFGINNASLSKLYVWNGGAGVCLLPSASAAGNGFFFMLSNEGTGNCVVTPNGSDTIDEAVNSAFSPSQSAFIVSTGSSWITVGKGTQTNFAFTLLNLNVAGSSNITLSSVQAQNVIQNYTGALTGNISVIVPNTVQLYIVDNQTTGAFNLTVQTALGTGIQVPQSSTSILYCDGTNVLSAFSFVPSGSTFAGGSATSPGVNWSGNTNTGIYQPATNQVGIATAGLPAWIYAAQAAAVNYFESTASATTNALELQAIGSDGAISIGYVTKGTGSHIFQTGGGTQAGVLNAANAVNYLTLIGGATTATPTLGVAGSDTNISLGLGPQGQGYVIAGGTSGFIVPSGTTAQRFGTINGTLRVNSSIPQLEVYLGGWSTVMLGANNLLDLQSAPTARTNLGVAPGAGLQQSGSTLLWDFTTEQTIASATTTDLGTKTSNVIEITGTTTITGLGSSANTNNPMYFVRFGGVLTLTNGANLILPGSANVVTAAGDNMIAKYEGTGAWRIIGYFPASGGSIIPGGVSAFSGDGTFASNSSSTGAVTLAIKNAAAGSVWGNATGAAATPIYTAAPVLGVPSTTAGKLGLAASGAAGTITLQNLGAGSSYNFNLPTTAGSTNQIFMSGAGGATSNLWSTATYPVTTTVNQLLWSSSANVIAGLPTANSSFLITSAGGVPSWSTTLPSGLSATNLTLVTPTLGAATATSITFSPTTGGIVGTNTNDNAGSGKVGQLVESSIPVGSSVSLSSAAPADVTSISLTAGDWDVWGNIVTNPGSGTTTGLVQAWITTASATIPTLPNGGAYVEIPYPGAPPNQPTATPAGQLRLSLSTTTTVFLSTAVNFGVSTLSAYGYIGARRVR